MIVGYMGNEAPDGWLLCDGSKIPDDEKFNALRTMIGNRVPDMGSNWKYSVMRGISSSKGLSTGKLVSTSPDGLNRSESVTRSDQGRSENTVRTIGQLPERT